MFSECPCEICSENFGTNTWYQAHAKNITITLCSQCRAKIEEQDGLSHHFVAENCPTCGHRRHLNFVKYTEKDPEARQCAECLRWLHKKFADFHDRVIYTNRNGHKVKEVVWVCDECETKVMRDSKKKVRMVDDDDCPNCGRLMKTLTRTRPNGKVFLVYSCWYCDEEFEGPMLKQTSVRKPHKVAGLPVEGMKG